jgi:superfamily II DNA or RNA helicase
MTRENPATIATWLEILVENPTVENSIGALRAQLEIVKTGNQIQIIEAFDASIVLCLDGKLAKAKSGFVFILPPGKATNKFSIVHPEVLSDEVIREYLINECGITEDGDDVSLQALLATWDSVEEPSNSQWQEFWETVKASGIGLGKIKAGLVEVRPKQVLYLKNAEGNFAPFPELLLEGSILKRGRDDDKWIVDPEFLRQHKSIIEEIGVVDVPMIDGGGEISDPDFSSASIARLRELEVSAATARREIRSTPSVASHTAILEHGSQDARSRYTSFLLKAMGGLQTWTTPGGYVIDSPTTFLVKKYGLLETSKGPRRAEETLSSALSRFERVAPVSKLPAEVTEGLPLLNLLKDLPYEDAEAAVNLSVRETDPYLIGEVFSQLCEIVHPPERVPALKGREIVQLTIKEVVAAADPNQINDFIRIEKPIVIADGDEGVQRLNTHWGIPVEALEFEVVPVEQTDPVSLEQIFSYLKIIKGNEIRGKRLIRCGRIYLEMPGSGLNSLRVTQRLQGGDLYVVTEGDDWYEKVLRIANSELKLELSEAQIQNVLDNRVNNAVRELTQAVHDKSNDVDRIATLFSVDELSSFLRPQILEELGGACRDPEVLAQLVLAVHGPLLLREARVVLSKKGFSVPSQWAGNESTVRFVTELGFEQSFAGFKSDPRPQHQDVQPFIEPITLRDYQISLKDQIQSFIDQPKSNGEHRALLYLPTGAGKTMVTVQALLEHLSDGKFGNRPILWIAQSDELCEQAARTFEEVWSTIGRGGVLSLDRFWSTRDAFHSNIPDEHVGQVVVATIQKLVTESVVENNERYEWLRDSAIVVIDEAHKAGEKSYTKVLNWLGTGVGRRKEDERPLLGLSATPLGRIRTRFGNAENYLRIEVPRSDEGAELTDVEYLREIGVLSTPRFEVLSGVEVELSEVSSNKLNGVWLPDDVEERLATNMQRNRAIIQSIQSLPSDHSIIVFALSVPHAQLLAALLRMNGISAAAISGDTPAGTRRHIIGNFRKGKIQVLTNFGVLTTGFDAPKIQAVYVARPTFSPSLYLQMIGRGLRGPLHGGTEECLIVDIEDNLQAFDVDLIFEKMSKWLSGKSKDSPFDVAQIEEE